MHAPPAPLCGGGIGSLANGDFSQPILDCAFDWRLPSAAGVSTDRLDTPALQVAFTGNHPEQFEVISHFLPLSRGTAYALHFQYKTLDLPRQTGLFWSLAGQQQSPLPAAETWSEAEWRFQAPAETARLALNYRRCPGTTRTEGKLLLRKIELRESL